KQQVEIPKEIIWDGHDESGARLPDGEYSYTIRAWDENNNTGESGRNSIFIDTVAPKVDPSPVYMVFSINKDSSKQVLPVSIKSSDIGSGDKVHAAIVDFSGKEIKTYDFVSTCPSSITWDGHDNNNTVAPEGDYSFYMKAYDLAGNKTEKTVNGIRLVTNYENIDATAGEEIFSPTNDSTRDTVTFMQKASATRGLEEWSLKIYNGSSNVVREFKGAHDLPDEVVWNGRDNKNTVVPDGIYSYDTGLTFDSGNHPVSQRKTVRVRTTPPFIVIKPEYMSFSPNNTETRNTIVFDNTIEGDDDDTIDIRILDFSGNVVYYNSYQKKDFPDKFIWNGRDKDLQPLPEGKYTYIVDGEDKVGNKNSKQITGIVLKTGLEKISVQGDLIAFSPKNQISNRIVFSPSVTSKDNIIDFNLSIRDEKNNIVRSFDTNTFLSRIEWDGTDNSARNLARDGTYSYQLKVRYDYGNELSSALKTVKLLTKTPDITITPDYTVFSPNGDGNKETLTIRQHTGEGPDISYTGVIFDKNNKPVRSYKWDGSAAVPAQLVWDGTDEKDQPAPEGYYRYEMTGSDIAGNRTVKTIDGIKMVRTFEKLSFISDSKAFSPAADGNPNSVKFIQELSSTNGLEFSALTIYDSTGNRARQFQKTNSLDKQVIWDGKNDKGNVQPDGIYSAEMECLFDSGNDIKSKRTNIILDKIPPAYKLALSPDLFTPDGDGENDILYINLEVSALAGIRNWEIDISKKLENGAKGRVFRKFTGTNDTVRQIQWDGYSDDGQDLVESVQDYVLDLKAEDNVGNRLTNVTRNISVGVLVEKTPDGLRIRVSSIQFAFDKADMIGNYSESLDKVIYIIRKILSDPKKYGITDNYKIEVSGHTDDIGTDEYNQKLSEKRASQVYQYFLLKDIDPKILTYVGYGKTRQYKIVTPDMPKEKKDEYRARNRRVEFFIRK
ncbi:MAG: FlgD immunoglobulin-like domain containing protein, partial [Brevinematales bacterium]